jgi:hypothetical protein
MARPQHPPGTTFTMEAPTDSILGHVGGAQVDLGNSFNLTAPSPQRPLPPGRADTGDTTNAPPPGTTLTMEAPTDSILGHVGGAQIDLGNSFNLTGDAPSPRRPRPPPPPVAGTNRRRPPANTDHPKYNKDYHRYIVGLMSFVDGVQYRMDARFRPSYFLDLTPVDIARYFCLIAYGTAEPDMEHDFPSQARSSHLEFAKKAISWYMPNRLGHWQAQAHPPVGNPTKSVEVNDIIKVVKKKEVRGQGRSSNAKRPFTTAEWRKVVDMLDGCVAVEWKFKYSCVVRHMHHMILRPDDVSQFKLADLISHPQFLFALSQKVKWSKNVQEERACPDQILLGAMDPAYCILLSLACYFSWYLHPAGGGVGRVYMYASDDRDDAPKRFNQTFSRNFRTLLKMPEFQEASEDPSKCGVYSLRKYPTTFAKQAGGCIQEHIDIRGRWKPNRSHASDRYQSVEQPYIDAKVCEALCPGGAVAYVLKDGTGVDDGFIHEHVVPEFREVFGQTSNVPKVLGLALLWAVMDGSLDNRVPTFVLHRIRTEYESVKRLPEGVNPVKKVRASWCSCLFYCHSLLLLLFLLLQT